MSDLVSNLFGSWGGSRLYRDHHHSSPNHLQLGQFPESDAELLARSPTGKVIGYGITWTKRDGTICTTSMKGFDEREVRKAVLRSVIRQGWTYPRWWQWWRWDDTRPSLDFR